MNLAVQRKTQIARPLKVLIPMIKDELSAANEAGLEHYRRAGEMLLEAKEQLSGSTWTAWLTKNFDLSKKTAYRYMRLAERIEAGDRVARDTTLSAAIGERTFPRMGAWGPIRDAADKVNVERLAGERQTRDTEVKLHRNMALEVISLGYHAMATRMHPDRGGSKLGMSRLNVVRDELKSFAETRRFV